MFSLNRVELIGNLGKDAEIKYTQNGTERALFSVATERSYKDKQSGEWKRETDWHNVGLWRPHDWFKENLKSGRKVYVSGRLQTRSYDDRDGNKRYVTEIVAEDVMVFDRAPRQDQGHSTRRSDGPPRPMNSPDHGPEPPPIDDDVPF